MLRFTSPLWRHDGDAAWYFVTVPEDVSEAISDLAASVPRKGFGSVRVRVTVGATTWETSVFPESAERYVLPVKKAVRDAESLEADEPVEVSLELLLSS